MRVREAFLVVLTGSSVVTVANMDRVNILIDADMGMGGSGFAYQFLVDSHQLGETDAGQPVGGTSAILIMNLTGTARAIQIGASNQFVGAYSGPVVAHPSAASFSAIVPNSGMNGGPPTFGSANVPWPATFSLGHYVQPKPQNPPFPSNPWTGWVIYTDKSSGNLVAYKGSGTPTILAS